MKTYDIFLFDADDTLFDYDKAEAYALSAMFESVGFEYSEALRHKYREFNSEAWEQYEKGEISKDELQTQRFVRLFDVLGLSYDAVAFNERYLYELGKGSYLIEGAFDICKAVVSRGKKIYIVTNGILATQKSRIENSPIKDFISDFFVSEHVGYQKPQIAYFEYVFSHIPQVPKDKIIIIGDSLTADIAGGNNAGIDTCWYNSAGKTNTSGIQPSYEIKELREAHRFLAE